MRIREALPKDATSIARVHVDAWRATYRGIVPDFCRAGRFCFRWLGARYDIRPLASQETSF